MTATMMHCPACDLTAEDAAQWCERCGEALEAMPPMESPGDAAPAPMWRSTAAHLSACLQCGRPEHTADGFCVHCGQRRSPNSIRSAIDLGPVAGCTDRGPRRKRNEDALAVGRFGLTTVAVICDGVASATQSDDAALAATETGIRVVLDELASGKPPGSAAHAGLTEAASAAASVGVNYESNPPACTYVSAIVTATEVTISWVGDSRIYWWGAESIGCLTVDDCLAGRLAAQGVSADDVRYQAKHAYALDHWLGADSPTLDPHIETFTPPGPGLIIVCSDGLSRYLPQPADLAATPMGTPAATAQALTQRAIDAGGVDNVSVAVLAYPPVEDGAR
ncbi:protein phosphatase 2C domain-containing protein [Phytomonospora sp. NPDC050363]|uniref:PP2C family protein-serine/threonine phosphatase n=1 Tax=Phytomonospora sp. NPDC050363 TaxID=3155642 RepID=UPI0033C27C33